MLGIVVISLLIWLIIIEKYANKLDSALIYVPVATISINSNELITAYKITTKEIPANEVSKHVIIDINQIIGKYTSENCSISKDDMFYKECLVTD